MCSRNGRVLQRQPPTDNSVGLVPPVWSAFGRRGSPARAAASLLGACALVLAACGGTSTQASRAVGATSPSGSSVSPTTTAQPTPPSTAAPSPPPAAAVVPISWGKAPVSGPIGPLVAISCSSATRCLAVGGGSAQASPAAMLLSGASWSTLPPPSDAGKFTGVSCPTASTCVVVDDATFSHNGTVENPAAFIRTDSAWLPQALPSVAGFSLPVYHLTGVSCAGARYCVAVGSAGSGPVIVIYNGSAWALGQVPAGVGSLNAVACAKPGYCSAVGSAASNSSVPVVISESTGSWSVRPIPAGSYTLNGISCPSVSDCTAVGGTFAGGGSPGGNTVIASGSGGWVNQTVPGDAGYLQAVSCSSTSSCVAVGANMGGATVLSYEAADWHNDVVPSLSSASSLTWGDSLDGAACPSSSFCLAVGPISFSGPGGVILQAGSGVGR